MRSHLEVKQHYHMCMAKNVPRLAGRASNPALTDHSGYWLTSSDVTIDAIHVMRIVKLVACDPYRLTCWAAGGLRQQPKYGLVICLSTVQDVASAL